MGKIVKLNPFISEKVWGGSRLKEIKNIDTDKPIGESWDVSTLKNGSSKISSNDLSEICELDYLVKFIDTSDNLSIQVHPDDEYANKFENSSGKTECWIITHALDGAGVYLGLKKNITKKEFFTAVKNGLDISLYLNFIPVTRGDFFYIPAGAIHAIGSGVTLCEVQQASGITYRVWDWNRLGMDGSPRELHVDKAKDVINFTDEFNDSLIAKIKKGLLDHVGITNVVEHKDFKVQLFSNMTQKDIEINLEAKSSIVVLEGAISGDIDLDIFECGFVIEKGLLSLEVEYRSSFLVIEC